MFGLFTDKEADEFARRLAKDLHKRVPASLASAELERALKLVETRGQEYSREHKVGIVKQIRLSKTFQNELGELGYEDDFIKEITLALARAMREK